MQPQKTVQDLCNDLADTIVACWVRVMGIAKPLDLKTIRPLFEDLKTASNSHTALQSYVFNNYNSYDRPIFAFLNGDTYPANVWKAIKERFDATEDPQGIITFPKEKVVDISPVIARVTNACIGWVGDVEKYFRSLPATA